MVSAMTEQPQKKKGILERLFLKFMANWQEVKERHQKRVEKSQTNNETEEKSVYSEEEDSETEIEEDGIIGGELFGEDW